PICQEPIWVKLIWIFKIVAHSVNILGWSNNTGSFWNFQLSILFINNSFSSCEVENRWIKTKRFVDNCFQIRKFIDDVIVNILTFFCSVEDFILQSTLNIRIHDKKMGR